jgi:hypothetical protein
VYVKVYNIKYYLNGGRKKLKWIHLAQSEQVGCSYEHGNKAFWYLEDWAGSQEYADRLSDYQFLKEDSAENEILIYLLFLYLLSKCSIGLNFQFLCVFNREE